VVHLSDEIVVVTPVANNVIVSPDTRSVTISAEETVVNVASKSSNVLVSPEEKIIAVSAPGPPGPPGPTGPPAGAAIVYEQEIPAASWPIVHNLGRPVGVVVQLDTSEIVYTQIDQSDPELNVVVIVFPSPTAGKALVI
jgi:hypothetical protein